MSLKKARQHDAQRLARWGLPKIKEVSLSQGEHMPSPRNGYRSGRVWENNWAAKGAVVPASQPLLHLRPRRRMPLKTWAAPSFLEHTSFANWNSTRSLKVKPRRNMPQCAGFSSASLSPAGQSIARQMEVSRTL